MVDTPHSMKAVQSNLRDEIHGLRDELDQDRKNLERFYTRNEDDHKTISVQITELLSDKKALRMVGILVGIALGSIAGIAIWFSDRISDNSAHIRSVMAEEQGNAREGFQIAKDLRRDIDNNEALMHELQRLHRLRPAERNRPRPTEE